MKPWMPVWTSDDRDCLEACVASLVADDDFAVPPSVRDRLGCNWSSLQETMRDLCGIELRSEPLTLPVPGYDTPAIGRKALVGIGDDPDSGNPHAVILQDHDGSLLCVHDPSRDTPAAWYHIDRVARLVNAPERDFILDEHARCFVPGCRAWQRLL